MRRITSFEHTADKGVIVEADCLEALLEGAAEAMFATMLDLDGLKGTETREISVRGDGHESLMIAWLQELIFLFEVEDLVFFGFQVTSASETAVSATATGAPWPHDRPRQGAMVKAVTYHGLSVTHQGGMWRATMIFDV